MSDLLEKLINLPQSEANAALTRIVNSTATSSEMEGVELNREKMLDSWRAKLNAYRHEKLNLEIISELEVKDLATASKDQIDLLEIMHQELIRWDYGELDLQKWMNDNRLRSLVWNYANEKMMAKVNAAWD